MSVDWSGVVLSIPLQGSPDEELNIPATELPEDPGKMIEILASEKAPAWAWVQAAVRLPGPCPTLSVHAPCMPVVCPEAHPPLHCGWLCTGDVLSHGQQGGPGAHREAQNREPHGHVRG
eukprot:COSAG01_NODE_349_length_18469_cov_8.136364_12_plen_119_part_00